MPQRLLTLLETLRLPTAVTEPIAVETILEGMALDKKITNGQWVFILPRQIGQADIVPGIPREAIKNLLERQVPRS